MWWVRAEVNFSDGRIKYVSNILTNVTNLSTSFTHTTTTQHMFCCDYNLFRPVSVWDQNGKKLYFHHVDIWPLLHWDNIQVLHAMKQAYRLQIARLSQNQISVTIRIDEHSTVSRSLLTYSPLNSSFGGSRSVPILCNIIQMLIETSDATPITVPIQKVKLNKLLCLLHAAIKYVLIVRGNSSLKMLSHSWSVSPPYRLRMWRRVTKLPILKVLSNVVKNVSNSCLTVWINTQFNPQQLIITQPISWQAVFPRTRVNDNTAPSSYYSILAQRWVRWVIVTSRT